MTRHLMAAVALTSAMIALLACTRTVERVVVVTATPAAPSPTPQPNLTAQEAIGLVWERATSAPPCPGPETRLRNIWKDRALCECLGLWGTGQAGIPQWGATLEGTGRWKVTMACSGIPRGVGPSDEAEWSVDDETSRVIPVSGWAD